MPHYVSKYKTEEQGEDPGATPYLTFTDISNPLFSTPAVEEFGKLKSIPQLRHVFQLFVLKCKIPSLFPLNQHFWIQQLDDPPGSSRSYQRVKHAYGPAFKSLYPTCLRNVNTLVVKVM